MGNFNPNYFERKAGSLERAVLDAVNGVKTQINEASVTTDLDDDPKLFKDIAKMGVKVKKLGKPQDGYVEVELSGPQAKIDAANKKLNLLPEKKMDAVGKEDGDIDNDGDKDASDKYLAKRRKTIAKAMKSEADDFKPHMMYDPKTGKGYEAKTMEDHLRMKKMGYDHEKPKMENYDIGTPENTKAKLDATPGQSSDEWNQQVEIIQKKHTSMREALAKVWGFDEGKNPFEKNIDEKKEMGFKVEFGKGNDAGMAVYRDKKDAEAFAKRQPKPIKITKGMYDRFDEEDKTLTGKPMTKVSVDPDMKEKKN